MRSFIVAVLAASLFSCSSQPAQEDPPPVEEPPPAEETPPPPEEPPPPPPVEEPPPEPVAEPKKDLRYTGRTVVATKVERDQIRCSGADANASLEQNRATCAAQLQDQSKNPEHVIVVIDQQPGNGCPTCVEMLAEVSPVAANPPGKVLFVKETAGTLECNGGDAKLKLEETRKQCYDTLTREGSSLRAAIVLPMAVEEGEPCKSCISIVATGYTATVLP